LAALALASAAVVGFPVAASASVTLSIDPKATLLNKGAAVAVTGTVKCSFSGLGQITGGINSTSELKVTVSERVGGGIASGNATQLGIPCDGADHKFTVNVGANNPGKPFADGPAAASATYEACGVLNRTLLCEQGSAQKAITIGPAAQVSGVTKGGGGQEQEDEDNDNDNNDHDNDNGNGQDVDHDGDRD